MQSNLKKKHIFPYFLFKLNALTMAKVHIPVDH